MERKIIIVEDDPAISDILKIILEKNNYVVEEFFFGKPLLGNQIKWPDLFLVDKQLDDIDGLEICRHLKNQPQTKNIPVIIVSATPNLDRQVAEAGADAYLEKPFSSRLLLNTIEACIRNSVVH
jgi:DNA-binding response OmpR family regulator